MPLLLPPFATPPKTKTHCQLQSAPTRRAGPAPLFSQRVHYFARACAALRLCVCCAARERASERRSHASRRRRPRRPPTYTHINSPLPLAAFVPPSTPTVFAPFKKNSFPRRCTPPPSRARAAGVTGGGPSARRSPPPLSAVCCCCSYSRSARDFFLSGLLPATARHLCCSSPARRESLCVATRERHTERETHHTQTYNTYTHTHPTSRSPLFPCARTQQPSYPTAADERSHQAQNPRGAFPQTERRSVLPRARAMAPPLSLSFSLPQHCRRLARARALLCMYKLFLPTTCANVALWARACVCAGSSHTQQQQQQQQQLLAPASGCCLVRRRRRRLPPARRAHPTRRWPPCFVCEGTSHRRRPRPAHTRPFCNPNPSLFPPNPSLPPSF